MSKLNNDTKEYDKIINLGEKIHEEIENETLTDEQIEEIISDLSDNIGPISKKYRDIKEQGEKESVIPYNCIDKKLVKASASVTYDSDTGRATILDSLEENGTKASITEIMENKDIEKINSSIDDNMENVLKDMGFKNDTDILNFINILNRHRSGEKIKYQELPDIVKNMIVGLGNCDGTVSKSTIVKNVLDFFINEINIDKEFIDFQESLKKELDIPSVIDMYSDHLKENMEVTMLEKADKLEPIDADKANTLREISAAFTESYTYNRMIECIESHTKEYNRIDREVKRFKQHCRSFNAKYQNHKFNINDINLLQDILYRHFEDVTEDQVKKFIILFCRICQNMSPDNLVEHSYMYYTIKNILSLEYTDSKSDFYNTIINNIMKVFSII